MDGFAWLAMTDW